jgi:hypothetical protein
LTIFTDLCEAGSGDIRVYDAVARLVNKISFVGNAGTNNIPVDLIGFAHGIYYYLIDFNGTNGKQVSSIRKFAVVRSP